MTTSKRRWTPGTLGRVAAGLALFAAVAVGAAEPKPAAKKPSQAPKPIQVLLVTGDDLHNWRATAPVLAEQLRRDPRMEVRVVEDPNFLDSSAVDNYHVIVMHFKDWYQPAPGAAARANLKRAVEGGKGLVLVHFACGAWRSEKQVEWPEFVELSGRVWDTEHRPYHDPYGTFRVEIANPTHPIMQGLSAFDTQDELYTCLGGDRPIDVLAVAKSKRDQKDYPMAFTYQAAKGRVFHSVLGHDVKALEVPGVGELYRRGTAWAAGQSPLPAR